MNQNKNKNSRFLNSQNQRKFTKEIFIYAANTENEIDVFY